MAQVIYKKCYRKFDTQQQTDTWIYNLCTKSWRVPEMINEVKIKYVQFKF